MPPTGPEEGNASRQQARIFGRFERAVSARNYGGMGLGLDIVEQVASAHNGAVAVTSEPGRGTTVVLELPIA